MKPIFILGVMPRSGTNFLSDLLCLHPDCAAPGPVLEDYFLRHADILARYVDSVARGWRSEWGVEDSDASALFGSLGDGLVGFLAASAGGGRVVTKTPSVRNLDLFFSLFPEAHLLILVRDGRDVVESMVTSFGVDREWATRRWRDASRTVLDFDRLNEDLGRRYLIVGYEALWNGLRDELCRIFSFLGLAPEEYDFDAAASLPIRGSSERAGRADDTVDWTPTEKPSEFNPVERWRSWTRSQHQRFNWIAGSSLVEFGYPVEGVSPHQRWNAVWNRLLDARWLAGAVVRAVADRLRKRE